jgi:septal ring factor EnvC (AmiA/AmiB activator)
VHIGGVAGEARFTSYEQEVRFFRALGIAKVQPTADDLTTAAERLRRDLEQANTKVRLLESNARKLEARSSDLEQLRAEVAGLRRDHRLESARAQLAAEDAAEKKAAEDEWLGSFR